MSPFVSFNLLVCGVIILISLSLHFTALHHQLQINVNTFIHLPLLHYFISNSQFLYETNVQTSNFKQKNTTGTFRSLSVISGSTHSSADHDFLKNI